MLIMNKDHDQCVRVQVNVEQAVDSLIFTHIKLICFVEKTIYHLNGVNHNLNARVFFFLFKKEKKLGVYRKISLRSFFTSEKFTSGFKLYTMLYESSY